MNTISKCHQFLVHSTDLTGLPPGKEEMRLDIEDIIVGRELLYGQVTSRDLKVEVVLKLDGFANLT